MRFKLMTILITGLLLITACAGNAPESTPTVDPNMIKTQAVETFSADLTQTALAAPTETPSPTLTPLATFTPFNTPAGITPLVQSTIPVTASCYSMAFVSDVTIPDNTPVTPGQTFTKTWKVTNNGSCPWDAGFKFSFTGGDAMGGSTFTLPAKVEVNATTNISVTMTAPTNKTGTIRGNWRMSTAAGQFFGDEVYVVVVVGGSAPTVTTYP
jgi:Ig-like domain-containing protein